MLCMLQREESNQKTYLAMNYNNSKPGRHARWCISDRSLLRGIKSFSWSKVLDIRQTSDIVLFTGLRICDWAGLRP